MTSDEKSFYEPFIVALTRRDLLDLSVIDSRVKPSHFQWGERAEKHNRSDVLLQTHEILWIFSWPFCWVKSWNVRGEPDPTSWLTSSQLQWTQRIWTLVLVYWERARCTVRIQEPCRHWVMSYEAFTAIPVKTFQDSFILKLFIWVLCLSHVQQLPTSLKSNKQTWRKKKLTVLFKLQ